MMKTILIATDYSPAALNAADYAAQLALKTDSKLVLFHAWMIPVYAGESGTISYPVGDLENIQQTAILNEAERIKNKWGIDANPFQTIGFTVDEIANYARTCNCEVVVMGMRRADAVMKIFGSVATSFIKQGEFPLLLIPEKISFRLPKKILLATDFITQSNWRELDTLKEFVSTFDAGIHIINALPEKLEHIEVSDKTAGHSLEKMLNEYAPTWHYELDGDILNSIYKISDEIGADWIAAIHHKTSWLQNLFHKSTSKQLALNNNIPLLILPETQINP